MCPSGVPYLLEPNDGEDDLRERVYRVNVWRVVHFEVELDPHFGLHGDAKFLQNTQPPLAPAPQRGKHVNSGKVEKVEGSAQAAPLTVWILKNVSWRSRVGVMPSTASSRELSALKKCGNETKTGASAKHQVVSPGWRDKSG